MKTNPTEKQVISYFEEVYKEHLDDCGEINLTSISEDAQQYFGVITDFGNSDIEADIFEWAAVFSYDKEHLGKQPNSNVFAQGLLRNSK